MDMVGLVRTSIDFEEALPKVARVLHEEEAETVEWNEQLPGHQRHHYQGSAHIMVLGVVFYVTCLEYYRFHFLVLVLFYYDVSNISLFY